MIDIKLQENMKIMDYMTGHKITRHEIAGHETYCTKTVYITIVCIFQKKQKHQSEKQIKLYIII